MSTRSQGIGDYTREVESARDLLDVILQGVDDGITVQDPRGRIVFANSSGAHLIGYDSPEDLLAAPIDEVMGRFEVFDEDGRLLSPEDLPTRRARVGERSRAVLLGFRVLATGEERWSVVKATPIFDEDGTVRLVVNVFSDVTERRQAEKERDALVERERRARADAESVQQRFEFLAEASEILSSSLDYETTLASVARLAVPHIADWCAVHIVDDGSVQQLAVAHVDPSKVELAWELNRRYPYDPDAPAGVPNVLRTRTSEIIPEIPDELLMASAPDEEVLSIARDLGLKSSMVVPLIARERILGVISLVSAESGHIFTPEDLALAEQLAERAALAVDNAHLYQQSAQIAAQQAAILEHITDGIVVANPQGEIVYSNSTARQLMGIEGDPNSVAQLGSLLTPTTTDGKAVPVEESSLAHALSGETVTNVDRRINRPDGKHLVVQASATPVVMDDGTLLGAVAVFRDVTAERQTEREKEDFLSAAAHDLKTPIAAIKGVAQVLRRRLVRMDLPDTERLIHGMEQIDDTTTRMTRLVNDLLDASRLQMGRPLELNRSPVDLVALVRTIASAALQREEHHRLHMETSADEIVASVDQDRIERVLGNLLANAIKYSPDGGEIDVSVGLVESGQGRLATIQVRDHGIGIPADDLDHIFDRFFRARNVEGRIPGTGVGLASVRQIVEQHGGSVSVQSEEGEGATFTVCLPVA